MTTPTTATTTNRTTTTPPGPSRITDALTPPVSQPQVAARLRDRAEVGAPPSGAAALAALRRLTAAAARTDGSDGDAPTDVTSPAAIGARLRRDEEGSLLTEYGLLTVLGGTAVGLAMKFLSGGAIWELFGAVLDKAVSLVGA